MAHETGRADDANSSLAKDRKWWLFCLLIFALKFFLLALDPLPRLLMGDSGSYLWTAMTGWIPDDRSFFYGFVIRWVSVWRESLTPLLLLQAFLSGVTALVAASIGRAIFRFPVWLAYALGFICALDPLQLLWERYVMTETVSLFFYALILSSSLMYLRDRRVSYLVFVHLFGVAVISLRMSFLLVTQLNAVLLPFAAFLPVMMQSLRARLSWPARLRSGQLAAAHFLGSILLMLALHAGYKRLNGWLAQTKPTYLQAAGNHVLAAWAPVIEPEDAPDPRLAEIIRQGDEYRIKDLTARASQLYQGGFLFDRWAKVETDAGRFQKTVKQTALNALRRNPFQILGLGWRTFSIYWNLSDLRDIAQSDLGYVDLTGDNVKDLAERFHYSVSASVTAAPPSILQRYFLVSAPYCWVVLLSPIWGLLIFFRNRDWRFALFLLLQLGIIISTNMIFAVGPSLRYLQPASLLTLICCAICVRAGLEIRNRGAEPARS
ncbi:MAG: hypothetical protein QOJ05_1095 [Verrucomicrobiota bacterium]